MPQGKQFRFVRELGDEIVILDDQQAVAHRLDADAAAVWRACDGRAAPEAIAAATGLAPERANAILLELDELGLLTDEQPAATPSPGDATRRVVLRRAALAGAAIGVGLPAVRTIVVPTAAQAFNSQNTGPGDHSPGSSGGGGATTEELVASETPTAGSSVGGASKGGHGTTGKGGSSHHKSGSPAGPQVRGATDSTGGRYGSSSDDGLAIAGARSTVRAENGTLPFTGTDVVLRAAIGTGLLAAGIQARRFSREPPPPLP